MARFRCKSCKFDGHAIWTGDLICPECGTTDGVLASGSVEEMLDMEILEAIVEDYEKDQ